MCVTLQSVLFYPPEVLHFSVKANRKSWECRYLSGCHCCTSVPLCLFAVCLQKEELPPELLKFVLHLSQCPSVFFNDPNHLGPEVSLCLFGYA